MNLNYAKAYIKHNIEFLKNQKLQTQKDMLEYVTRLEENKQILNQLNRLPKNAIVIFTEILPTPKFEVKNG